MSNKIDYTKYDLSLFSIDEKKQFIQCAMNNDEDGIVTLLKTNLSLIPSIIIYESEKELLELQNIISKVMTEKDSPIIFIPHNNREAKPTYDYLMMYSL